jgi:transposase
MNDRIGKAVKDLGYCCLRRFFDCHTHKSDSNRKMANKLGVAITTIEYNKKKLKEGFIHCECRQNCMQDQPPKKL